jgi:hypothetical protein
LYILKNCVLEPIASRLRKYTYPLFTPCLAVSGIERFNPKEEGDVKKTWDVSLALSPL